MKIWQRLTLMMIKPIGNGSWRREDGIHSHQPSSSLCTVPANTCQLCNCLLKDRWGVH